MSAQTQLVARLAAAVSGVKGSFTCAGTYLPRAPVRLRFARSKDQVVFGKKPVLQPLLERAVQASFGKGEKTVRDRNVRDGLQLKAPAFTVEGFDPEQSGVLEEVTRALRPGAPGSLAAKLYDVNVYERGGLFVGHRDTPAERDLIGTLVVSLPARFLGGELVLTRDDESFMYDFSAAIDKQTEPARVHWAAFFSDVEHAVRPVKGGCRVTLTYRLVVKRAMKAAARETSAMLDRLRSELKSALHDARFMPRGGTLVFPCFHLYGYKTFPRAGPLNAAAFDRLKGRDRLVAAVARELGFPVELRPYLVEREEDDTWQLERFPTERDVHEAPRPQTYEVPGDIDGLTLADLSQAFPIVERDAANEVWVLGRPWRGKTTYRVDKAEDFDEDAADPENDDSEPEPEPEPELDEDEDEDESEDDEDDAPEAPVIAEPPPVNAGPLESEPLGPDRPALQFLLNTMFSTTGLFGNEGGEGNFYLFAALALPVPEAAKRGLSRTTDAIRAAALRAKRTPG